MARDREKTSRKIKQAAINLLLREGFQGWGINSVARCADVDKVLIYRYFGSLSGLLQEIVSTARFWPDPGSVDADTGEAFIAGTIRALQADPLWQLLYGLPANDECRDLVDKKAAEDRDAWLGMVRANCTGTIAESDILCLPALIQFRIIDRQDRLSAGEIWRNVSPPLQWITDHNFESFGELPTELL